MQIPKDMLTNIHVETFCVCTIYVCTCTHMYQLGLMVTAGHRTKSIQN